MVTAPSGALIFRASGNAVSEIYRVNADGTNLVNLSATGNQSVGGTPSPNGSRVALTRDQHVVLVNPGGSDPVDLGPGTFISWSPDGERILYGNFGESFGEWWIKNRDGSGARLVVPRCAQCASPQWLPDSQRLVAELGGESYNALPQLFVIDTNGAQLQSLPIAPGARSELSLSPDGREILVVERPQSGADSIKVMSTGGAAFRTVWSGTKYVGLSWSPDSAQIAFAAQVVVSPGGPSPPPLDAELVVVDLATGASRVLDGGGGIYDIAWSPNGQTLAYAAAHDPARMGRVLIYTRPAARGTPTTVSNGPWHDTAPTWSADSQTIAFSSDRSSKDGLYALDPTSGEPILLQQLPPGGLTPGEQPTPPRLLSGCIAPPKLPGEGFVSGCLSPDGKRRTAVTEGRVVVSDVRDGSVLSTSANELVAQNSPPAWSPDGTRVAYFGGSALEARYRISWIYLLDVVSGQSTRLVTGGAFGSFDPSVLWSRDGATLYFTSGGYCTGGCIPGYLFRIAPDGSGEQKLTDLRVVQLYGFAP